MQDKFEKGEKYSRRANLTSSTTKIKKILVKMYGILLPLRDISSIAT